MSEEIHKLQRALLDADTAGNRDGVEFFKAEISRRQQRASEVGGSASSANPSLSQAEANSQLAQSAKKGLVKTFTETLPQIAAEGGKGAITLGMLPGELIRSFANKMGGDPADFGRATEMLHKGIDSIVPPPEGRLEKPVVEVLGAAALGPLGPGNAVRNTVTAGMSALGGIAGRRVEADMTGDNGGVIGGLAGSLLGGTPTSIFKGRGNHKEMLAEALKGVKPGDFATARRLQADANAAGIRLTPEQLFPNPTGLDNLMKELLSSGSGDGRLQSLVMDQTRQAQGAVRNAGNRLGPSPQNEAAIRDMRNATAGAIDDVRLTPSQRAQFDEDGKMLSAPQIQAADARLSEAMKSMQASEARKPIQEFQTLLRRIAEYRMEPGGPVGPLRPGQTGEFRMLPLTEELLPKGARDFTADIAPDRKKLDSFKATDLDTMIKEALLKLKDLGIGSPGIAKRQQGQVAGVLDDIRAILDDITPTRVAGRQFETTRHELRNALTAGLTGKIAGRHGVTESMPDALGTLRSALGAPVAQEQAIGELAAALRSRAQKATAAGDLEGAAMANRALPQAARLLWNEAVDKAFTSSGGRVPATAGASFYTSLVGLDGSAKSKNFDQMMQGVAAAQGLNPTEVKNGMRSVLRALEASGRNRQGVGFAGEALERAAGESAVRDTVRSFGPLSLPSMMGEKLRNIGRERQYRELSRIFSDPDALRLIEQIGQQSIVSSVTGARLQTLFQMLQQGGRADSDVRAAEAEKAKKESPYGP